MGLDNRDVGRECVKRWEVVLEGKRGGCRWEGEVLAVLADFR